MDGLAQEMRDACGKYGAWCGGVQLWGCACACACGARVRVHLSRRMSSSSAVSDLQV